MHHSSEAAGPPWRVLLAEGELWEGEAIASMLRAAGHEVAMVTTCEEALAAIEAAPSPFDAICVSESLTGGGLSLAERLRPLPAVLLATSVRDHGTLRAQCPTHVRVLPKPIKRAALLKALGEALG
jgi:CheY-like chemotaxis protein